MYFLSRSAAESIQVGNNIKVTVVSFHPYKNEVCLGIEVPSEVLVHPAELNKEDLAIWQEAINYA